MSAELPFGIRTERRGPAFSAVGRRAAASSDAINLILDCVGTSRPGRQTTLCSATDTVHRRSQTEAKYEVVVAVVGVLPAKAAIVASFSSSTPS